MNPVACIGRQWERMGRIGSRAHERTHMHGRTKSASKHEPRPFAYKYRIAMSALHERQETHTHIDTTLTNSHAKRSLYCTGRCTGKFTGRGTGRSNVYLYSPCDCEQLVAAGLIWGMFDPSKRRI